MVEHIADFALLALDVSIARTLATEHAHHQPVEQMLGRVGGRELILVVPVENQVFVHVFIGYYNFIDDTSVGRHIHLHSPFALEDEPAVMTGEQFFGLPFAL